MAAPAQLRILIVQRSMPAHVPGGLERHGEDLALGLAAAGCVVHLLTAPLPEAERARYAAAGIQVHAAAAAHPQHYTARYLLSMAGEIRALLARERFDAVHGQEFALGFWKPRPGDPPLVLSVHGTITSETPLHPDVWRQLPGPRERLWAWARFGRRHLYGPVWRRALGAARLILVDSDFSRSELLRLSPPLKDKIRRLPLALREAGPEPEQRCTARASLDWRGVQLLTVGRLEWQKGHELALEALAPLRPRGWHYTIAGTGSYRPALRRAVARLGLEDRVTFAGWVDEETKRRMLAGADLFLWPERTHPAFGLAGLEALLAGTPALATRRGAIPEVLGDERWLTSGDPQRLSEQLGPLLEDPARLARAREGLRQRTLARFDFQRMIATLLALYREACAARARE